MKISLFELFFGFAEAFDCVEDEMFQVPYEHSKRMAMLTVSMGQKAGLSKEELSGLALASLAHENGLTRVVSSRMEGKLSRDEKGHLMAGEENLQCLSGLSVKPGLVLFHHENADGSGPFRKKGKEIPLEARLIRLADWADSRMSSGNLEPVLKNRAGELFLQEDVELFLQTCPQKGMNGKEIHQFLLGVLPEDTREWNLEELGSLGYFIARVVDERTGSCFHSREIAARLLKLAEHYRYPLRIQEMLYLSGALHDLGKLMIPVKYLNKPGKLTEEEFRQVQNHALYTYYILNKIPGLEEVTLWASNHHEKLNGKGYPFGRSGEVLSYPERMVACMDIYQALRERRAYKAPLSHEKAVEIMKNMAGKGFIDKRVVWDIEEVFGGYS